MNAIRYFFMYLGFATFACTVLLLGVGCIGEFRYWLAHRHDQRDQFGNYLEGLRSPGMGDLRLLEDEETP